jgi:AcrR family transcriptional regulator
VSIAPAVGTKGVPRPDRERQIVDVAIGEFAARGYATASMVDIARRAGISKPLVYQYFGSKDGLYLACLHAVAGEVLARLERAERAVDDSVSSRIHPLRAVFEALEPRREAWRLLYDTSRPGDGPIAAAATDYQARITDIAASGSARFLAARGIHDAADASALSQIWMAVVDAVVGWWLDHPDESAAAMVERCGRLLGAVLR